MKPPLSCGTHSDEDYSYEDDDDDEFARTHARSGDPDTSHAAAASLGTTTVVRGRVMQIHEDHPAGLTDEELVAHYIARYPAVRSRESQVSSRKRRSDLLRDGLLRDSGQRRGLASGRRGIVWVVARKGEA